MQIFLAGTGRMVKEEENGEKHLELPKKILPETLAVSIELNGQKKDCQLKQSPREDRRESTGHRSHAQGCWTQRGKAGG